MKIFIFAAAWVSLGVSISGCQDGTVASPSHATPATNSSAPPGKSESIRPVIIYIQTVRSDTQGYSLFAQDFVDNVFCRRQEDDVALIIWPERRDEKPRLWRSGDAKRTAKHLVENIGDASVGFQAGAFANGLKIASELARNMKADIIVISNDDGIAALTANEKMALLSVSN